MHNSGGGGGCDSGGDGLPGGGDGSDEGIGGKNGEEVVMVFGVKETRKVVALV